MHVEVIGDFDERDSGSLGEHCKVELGLGNEGYKRRGRLPRWSIFGIQDESRFNTASLEYDRNDDGFYGNGTGICRAGLNQFSLNADVDQHSDQGSTVDVKADLRCRECDPFEQHLQNGLCLDIRLAGRQAVGYL